MDFNKKSYEIENILKDNNLYSPNSSSKLNNNLLNSTKISNLYNSQKNDNIFQKINRNNQKLIKLIKLNKTEKILSKFENALFDINFTEENQNDSFLHILIVHNNQILFKWLLKKGINLNITNKFKHTPLIYCVFFNNFEFFNKLIKRKVNVNKIDNYGNSCLHYICYYSRIEFLVEILKTDININILNNYNLLAISYIKDRNIFKFLLFHPKFKLLKKLYSPLIFNDFLLSHPKEKYLNKILNYKKSNLYERNNLFKIKYDYIKNYIFFEKFNIDYLNIENKLGQGSFGVVYLVTHKINNEKYAMKVFDKADLKKKGLLKTLKIEKLIVENLNCPFILKSFFNFENKSKFYLLLEYCKFGDLNKINKLLNGIDENSIKIIFCELLLGLKALHRNNILHRDIKPHNIVLNKDGHIRLIDFGLSKWKTNKKKVKTFVGSYAYMTPEMILGKHYDRTLDYYMLGITILELLNGSNPFISTNLNELKFKIVYKTPEIKSKNKLLKNIISKLLTKNKKLRLGYKNGIDEIMSHPYFENINWKLIKKKKIDIFKEAEIDKIKNSILK